ncbi:MAG: PA2778 family cysteine peptidase [Pseudomonadota bacterium]
MTHDPRRWPRGWATPAGLMCLVLAVLLLNGCATPLQTRDLLRDPPDEMPRQVELDQTPFHPQELYQCGPAALATVLGARGLMVHPDDLVDEVYLPERQGSLQTEMLASARARGFVAYVIEPHMETLLKEVAAGQPVLVFQNLGLNAFPYWHYAVVIGFDLDAEEIILRSGTIRRHVTPMPVFERTWRRGNYWAFVVQPPGQLPTTAQPLPWLRAANALEATGQLDTAATAYQTAARHWPEHPVAWIGLGNTLYALEDHTGAEQAFRQLIQTDPEAHAAWNNLAHVLHARGCGTQALEAVTCALRMAPDEPHYQRTRETVKASPDTPTGNDTCLPALCPIDHPHSGRYPD